MCTGTNEWAWFVFLQVLHVVVEMVRSGLFIQVRARISLDIPVILTSEPQVFSRVFMVSVVPHMAHFGRIYFQRK